MPFLALEMHVLVLFAFGASYGSAPYTRRSRVPRLGEIGNAAEKIRNQVARLLACTLSVA